MRTTLLPSVSEYLGAHHVMTLATQGAEGPWAAAVFYATDGDTLIFLSSPNSRHCRNLTLDGRCAATIQDNPGNWRQIQGIQMEGRVRHLQQEEKLRAQQIYGEKFPVVGERAKFLPSIAEALAKIAWFKLVPVRLYFVDNSRGFGHRDEIELRQD